MSSKKDPYHTTRIAFVSCGAVVVADQGWKCVLRSKAKPLPSRVVRIHPSLRGSVDFFGVASDVL